MRKLLLICLFALAARGGDAMAQAGYPKEAEIKEVSFYFKVEGFYTHEDYDSVEVGVDGAGKGSYVITYYTKPQEKGTFALSQERVKELAGLCEDMDFLRMDYVDLNVPKITVTDVGTTTITYKFRDVKRTISYGYVEDPGLNRLASIFWQMFETAKEKPLEAK